MAESPTRTEEVFESLQADLLDGRLTPGTQLKMIDLSERFGASQSVLREALTRLSEQGLVLASPQRGFRVHELTMTDLVELTEARARIESFALQLAMQRGDIHWETQVLGAFHLLEAATMSDPDKSINVEWSTRHRAFHAALLGGSGNSRLERLANSLRGNAELYRPWLRVLSREHRAEVGAEHRALRDLALRRDDRAALRLLTSHVKNTPRQVLAYAREHGTAELVG